MVRGEGEGEMPMFLDCVWQVMVQFPCAFELTGQFVKILLYHSQVEKIKNFGREGERSELN